MKERDIDAAIPGVITLLGVLVAAVILFIGIVYWLFS